jgi:long-chain acyl-CoA synthetase
MMANVVRMSDTAAQTKPWPAMSIAQAHALLTQPGSPLEMAEAESGV